MRLDRYLLHIGAFDSRQKAQEAIKEGRIKIGGVVIYKPSWRINEEFNTPIKALQVTSNNKSHEASLITPSDKSHINPSLHKCHISRIASHEASHTAKKPHIDINATHIDVINAVEIVGDRWVSRSAQKLAGFLAECAKHELPMKWRSAIDVGAARGGFSEVLLRHGVEDICCVDVGRNQLHRRIAEDMRIEVFEQCDIRAFVKHDKRRFDVAVCDVSFISLACILDALCALSDTLIVLCKPQFEVGKDASRTKRGVVRDSKAITKAVARCVEDMKQRALHVRLVAESSVLGKEGNAEFFLYACR